MTGPLSGDLAAWAAATAQAPEIIWPKYADDDPDRIAVNGIAEPASIRADRKKQEAADAAEQQKLIAKLEADPNSTQGTVSFAHGFTPEELADPAATPTEIETLENELGFKFGDPDGDASNIPAPTMSLICRNPECSMSGQHVAVHTDTIQPIHCGGLITNLADNTTRPCGNVLLCDHVTVTSKNTTGTLANPVEIETTRCTKCGTITAETKTPLPPIQLGDLPIAILDTIGTTPGDITFTGTEPSTA